MVVHVQRARCARLSRLPAPARWRRSGHDQVVRVQRNHHRRTRVLGRSKDAHKERPRHPTATIKRSPDHSTHKLHAQASNRATRLTRGIVPRSCHRDEAAIKDPMPRHRTTARPPKARRHRRGFLLHHHSSRSPPNVKGLRILHGDPLCVACIRPGAQGDAHTVSSANLRRRSVSATRLAASIRERRPALERPSMEIRHA